MTALYVHIPFCVKKCAYCDFASFPGRMADAEAYVRAVLREAAEYAGASIDTVFLGGGTPSLLALPVMETLLGGLGDLFAVARGVEWTVECNPGAVDPAKMRMYRRRGVNRLSFGAQAAQACLLRTLGRIHVWQDVEQAVADARDADFDNLNLDLMYALPGQTMADWRDTLEKAAALRVEHISAYSLILEEGTPLAQSVARGALSAPDDDAALAMQHSAEDFLARHGLPRYEISNYAVPGRECRHNIAYWTRGDYIGLGCAAHSFYRGERYRNPDQLDAYLAGERRLDRRFIPPDEALEEAVMLGTRMTRGVSLREIKRRYACDLLVRDQKVICRLCDAGFVVLENDRLFLTSKGLDVQDAVVLELLP